MLSFIIPARDEEATVGRCVSSILRHCPAGLLQEVLVVDNGSADDTAGAAATAGARVVESRARSIGGVRNDGVRASVGQTLVFVDADCVITEQWGAWIERVVDTLDLVPRGCAGSQVFPPTDGSVFLWRHWFRPFVSQGSASHIGSANMTCHREVFLAVGGFDERMATGEDYDFCARLRAAGGTILNIPELRVEHYGFPRTMWEFFNRERWHGRGDVLSPRSLIRSKVAVGSMTFVGSAGLGLVLLLAGYRLLGLGLLSVAMTMLLAASIVKFRHAGPAATLISLSIMPVYFLARTLSVVDAAMGRPMERSAVRSSHGD